jgi:hydrophobe/amphiphile efflux-1 (HAE1) family protein
VSLTEACIRKPVFAWMLMAATVLFGLVAITRMGISQYPDVDYPTITVSVPYEGASPEVLENDVIEPLEESLAQVEGVKSISASARQGQASVTAEFVISRDIKEALQDVQSRVAQARLPPDIDPPVISKSNPEDQPIMWVGLYGPYSRQLLSDVARYRMKDRLQSIDGVGEIQLGGYLERNVRIWINSSELDARQLTVSDVITALGREHVELPAGLISTDSREVSVRVLGEALDLKTLAGIVVRQTPAGPVYLKDVALVEDGFEDERRRSRTDGNPVQGMGIRKQRGANAVQVAKDVRHQLAELQKTLPDGMAVTVIYDGTRYIEESVHEVQFELVLAVVLTALVCWMFLGSFSSTLNVVLAIPMSLLGTIAVIYFLGFTLNTFTLLALSLAVGIVVDDAIMVMENIFRHAEEGKPREQAARDGTKEIAFAALAATTAVIAIFIPVVFMKGVIGKYFLQFGVTLSVAVALSYVEAITLAPARCAQLLRTSREHRSWLGRTVDRLFDRLSQGYTWVLRKSLRWPLATLGLAAIVVVLAFGVARSLPAEMVPSQDQSRLMVRIQTTVGSSLEETDRITRRAEAFVNNRPEVAQSMFNVGGGGGGAGVNQVFMLVTLKPPDQRKISQAGFAQLLRKELNGYPGVRAVVQDPSQTGFGQRRGFPIEISVRGNDWDKLIEESAKLQEKLATSGIAVDIDSDYKLGAPELQIRPDRARAADLGVPIEQVATSLNALVGGLRIGKYSSNGRRIDVRVKLLADQRSRPEDLAALHVRSDRGELVPLAQLVTQEEKPALQTITRRDRERSITVTANVAPGHAQKEALDYIQTLSKEMTPGISAVPSGASVAFQDSFSGLWFALGLGILIAYMVLASQFNSFLHPVTVLVILPVSVAGAIFALALAGRSLNIFSAIGLLLLIGIVKKNSIILVDYANQVREHEQANALDAMLKAGPVRLRPILMTSIATMVAAIPAALAIGPGSETRAPMALAVIGGLVVSTLLSLFVVPSFYVVADRVLGFVRGHKKTDEKQATPDGETGSTLPGT